MKINLNTVETVTSNAANNHQPTNHGNKKPAEGRNDYLFKLACLLVSRGLPEEAIEQAVQAINMRCTDEQHTNFVDGPLPIKEVQTIVKSALKYKGDIPPESGYMDKDAALKFMDEKHAIVMEAGKTIVISERYDEMLERYIHERSSFADIRNFHSQRVLIKINNGSPVTQPLGKFWTEHPDARKYSRVVFEPSSSSNDYYNLWRGFAFTPTEGDWSLLRDHIYKNVCGSNDVWFKYFMSWVARMIQKPDCPGEVAIVLRGKKGTGKSITWRHIGKLFGQHYLQISNSKHLVGNFNSHLQDTILLFADEAFYAGDKKQEPILKTIITEPVLFIEPKNINAFTCPNFLHLAMASNNRWVVPASGDERRYFVLDVSDAQKQNSDYFAAISEQMKNGGYQAMLHDLLKYDISAFDPRRVPQTPAMQEQKLESLDPIDLWLLERLEAGEWLLEQDNKATRSTPKDHWTGPLHKKDIQDEYYDTMRNQGVTRRSSSTKLGMYLSSLFPTMRKTESHYYFPSLDECRRLFEEAKNNQFDWPESERGCDVF
ncbi:MAG: hypothetical protein CL570_00380 [Alphaproteobacteria bacterium]|nr:hypothetical protein [Alphaproteobacteria bacterium]|tara:strand:- start:2901 stop:4532 length:1632 start_codon:yes stop_codon:yes gene_type:complete